MYYNRILRIWVVDPLDWFLISLLMGSLAASGLKDYLSEKEARKRLVKSIIKQSRLVRSKTPISSSKEAKKKQIYRFALTNRGGQMSNSDVEMSNELYKLAQEIRNIVERLAQFLKEKELKGAVGIMFKGGRLILELILYRCNISIDYVNIYEGVSTQVIVFTLTAGGAAGFTIAWFSTGAALVSPILLSTVLFARSFIQQVQNQIDYLKFKAILTKMLDDDELKETLVAAIQEFKEGTPAFGTLEIQSRDFDKEPALKHDFNLKSDQTPEEFIKARMEEELGLVENPTQEQLEKIIHRRKITRKPKGKTVYFRDFIDEIAEGPDDIIDAEIVKEPIRFQVKNEEL